MPFDEDGHWYEDRNDRDRGRSGSESDLPTTKSAEDAKRAIEKNKNTLSNIQLKTDDEGNANLLGFKVDKAALPTFQLVLDQGKVLFLEKGKDVYKAALQFARKVGLKGESANTAAIAVDMGVRWGVIGAEQLVASGQASSAFAQKRRDLYQRFNPVMQATGINAGNNEVISLAYQRARNQYGDELRDMLSDVPRILPMALLGIKEQTSANARYSKEFEEVSHKSMDAVERAKQKADKSIELAMERVKAEEAADKFVAEQRNEWVKKKTAELKGEERSDPVKKRSAIWSIERSFKENVEPQLRSAFRQENEQKFGAPGNEDKEKADRSFNLASLGGNLVSQLLRRKDHEGKDDPSHVPEMIEHLQKEITNQCEGSARKSHDGYGRCDIEGKTADDIQITGMGHGAGSMSLKAYILEMFQQHERDRTPGISWVKRDKSGHVTEVVDPLGQALVAKLEPSIDIIADAVATGLDPAALINLIGGNKVIIHGKNGAKTFANEDRVREEIDKLIPVMSSHEIIKLEEYLAKFEKPEEIKGIIKANLENMKGDERVLFAALFPDDILRQLGMSGKEITTMRKEAHTGIYDFVAANVFHLAKQDDAYFKKLGLAESEIQAIHDLAEKIEAGDEKALKIAVDGHDKSVIDAVRTAGILEQNKDKSANNYWSERVAEIPAARKKLEEAKKDEDLGEDRDASDTHHEYEGHGRDDDDDEPKHADKVSKKSKVRSDKGSAKKSRDSRHSYFDLDSKEGNFEGDYSRAYEGKKGRNKSSEYERSDSFLEREKRGRDSAVDDEISI